MTKIIIEIIIIKTTQYSLCTKRPYLMCHRNPSNSVSLSSLTLHSPYLSSLCPSLSSHSLTKSPSLITLCLPHSLRLSPILSFSCLTSFSSCDFIATSGHLPSLFPFLSRRSPVPSSTTRYHPFLSDHHIARCNKPYCLVDSPLTLPCPI
jgi:hypothetical protein